MASPLSGIPFHLETNEMFKSFATRFCVLGKGKKTTAVLFGPAHESKWIISTQRTFFYCGFGALIEGKVIMLCTRFFHAGIIPYFITDTCVARVIRRAGLLCCLKTAGGHHSQITLFIPPILSTTFQRTRQSGS